MSDDYTIDAEVQEAPEAEAPESDSQEFEDQPGEGDQTQEGEGELSTEDDGLVDLELDGKIYRVPEALKNERMMHADYTRKTQELAEQRRELEQAPNPAQESEEDLQDRGVVANLTNQLSEWENVDWDRWQAEDFLAAQSGWRQYQQMQQNLKDAKERIATRDTQRTQRQQHTFAKAVEDAQRVITQDIKGWGPELASKVTDHARSLGFDDRTIQGLNTSPAAVKALWQSHMWAESQKQQSTANKKQVEPLAKPKGRAKPVSTGPSDGQSIDAWMAKRNAQTRR